MKKYTLYSLMLLTLYFYQLVQTVHNLRKKTMYNLLKMLRLKFQKRYSLPQKRMKLLMKMK